jgi:hypothetical protein
LDVSAPVPSPPPDQPTTAAVASSRRDPDDDWGEGPDPGRAQEPNVQLVAQYGEMVKFKSINMAYLNAQGGTIAEHLAAIRGALAADMKARLEERGPFRIYLKYVALMSHLQGVCILFRFFCSLLKYSFL